MIAVCPSDCHNSSLHSKHQYMYKFHNLFGMWTWAFIFTMSRPWYPEQIITTWCQLWIGMAHWPKAICAIFASLFWLFWNHLDVVLCCFENGGQKHQRFVLPQKSALHLYELKTCVRWTQSSYSCACVQELKSSACYRSLFQVSNTTTCFWPLSEMSRVTIHTYSHVAPMAVKVSGQTLPYLQRHKNKTGFKLKRPFQERKKISLGTFESQDSFLTENTRRLVRSCDSKKFHKQVFHLPHKKFTKAE